MNVIKSGFMRKAHGGLTPSKVIKESDDTRIWRKNIMISASARVKESQALAVVKAQYCKYGR